MVMHNSYLQVTKEVVILYYFTDIDIGMCLEDMMLVHNGVHAYMNGWTAQMCDVDGIQRELHVLLKLGLSFSPKPTRQQQAQDNNSIVVCSFLIGASTTHSLSLYLLSTYWMTIYCETPKKSPVGVVTYET